MDGTLHILVPGVEGEVHLDAEQRQAFCQFLDSGAWQGELSQGRTLRWKGTRTWLTIDSIVRSVPFPSMVVQELRLLLDDQVNRAQGGTHTAKESE